MAAIIATLDEHEISEELLLCTVDKEQIYIARSAMNELASKDILYHGRAQCQETGDLLGSVWCFDTSGVESEDVEKHIQERYKNKKNLKIIKQSIVAMDDYVLEFAGRVRGEQNISRFIEKNRKRIAEGKCRSLAEWNNKFKNFMQGAAGEKFMAELDDQRIRYIIRNVVTIDKILGSKGEDLRKERESIQNVMKSGKDASVKIFIRAAKKKFLQEEGK
jgi:hypothetical protein